MTTLVIRVGGLFVCWDERRYRFTLLCLCRCIYRWQTHPLSLVVAVSSFTTSSCTNHLDPYPTSLPSSPLPLLPPPPHPPHHPPSLTPHPPPQATPSTATTALPAPRTSTTTKKPWAPKSSCAPSSSTAARPGRRTPRSTGRPAWAGRRRSRRRSRRCRLRRWCVCDGRREGG